jgi:hypothetical protein
MLGEILEYVFTPASRLARTQGFLRGAIQIRSRYGRCRNAWAPHLARTRRIILEAARLCPNRGRVLILGGGLIHDVPVAELCASFGEVLLADLAHPISSRFQTRRYRNLRRLEVDVSGVMAGLARPGFPEIQRPDLRCGEPDVDLVVSVNLLSQLCWAPTRILDPHPERDRVRTFLAGVVRAHLDALNDLPCAAALVTDHAWRRREVRTGKTDRWEVLQGIALPVGGDRWDWEIAPAPERERSADFTAEVVGYADWKQSGWA